MTMRWICMLALLAAPLMAQEESEPKKPSPYRQLLELMEKIDGVKPEERAELARRLREILEKLDSERSLEIKGGGTLEIAPAGAIVLEMVSNSGREKMSGSWSEGDGIRGEYTLTGLGKSRYRLEATRTGREGEVTKIRDEGTLAELCKKYEFLKSFNVVALTPEWKGTFTTNAPPAIGSIPLRMTGTQETIRSALGMKLRRPSKDLEYHLKIPTETAWIVDEVLAGSKAEELGLKKMDLITEADGEDLADFKSLENAKTALAVVRRGKTVRIALGDGSK